MKKYPGFKVIKAEFGGTLLCLYLIGDTCLVDTGVGSTPENVIFPFMQQQGIDPDDLSIVYVTHFHGDHCWGLGAIKHKNPTVTIMALEPDVKKIDSPEEGIKSIFNPYSAWLNNIEFEISNQLQLISGKARVNLVLKGREKLVLDTGQELYVIHTPGHSPGHSILHDSFNKCVFIGDAILGRGQGVREGIGFPHYENVDDYIRSIRTIRNIQHIDYLCTCHFGVLEGNEINSFVESSEDFVWETDTVIQQVLIENSKPINLWDLSHSVQSRIGSYVPNTVVTLTTVNAHLEHLRKAGVTETVNDPSGTLWKLTNH